MSTVRTGGDEIRLSRIAAAVLSEWRLIVWILLAALVVAAAFFALRPRYYAAVTTLIPAHQQQSQLSLLASQLNVPIPGALRSESEPTRLLATIARSRMLADSMVQRLATKGDARAEAEIRRTLIKGVVFRSNADASITVIVRSKNRVNAATIANGFASLLNTISTQMAVQVTQRKLENLHVQLAQALAQLQRSEGALVQFRRTGAAPVIEKQAEQTVEAAGEVQRSVMEQELKVAQLSRSMTPDNPEYRAAVAELNARRGQLGQLTADKPTSGGLYVPMRSAPVIAATALRLEREFERDQRIYAALAAGVAQAQIDMNNNLPILSVLDAALVPTQPAGISLPTLLILGVVIGLFVALATIAFRCLWLRILADPEARPLVDAWTDLKGTLLRRSTARSKVREAIQ